MSAPNELSAAEAITQLSTGKLTAEALMQSCLDRAKERASVKAWTWLDPDAALTEARNVDKAGRKGVIGGLPIGVKDIIDTADMPTQHGSPIYEGNRPFADAACIALIRASGGTIMGKTVTTEFANRFPGATVHPHNPAHTPGGSSSGSAAAVADFQVPAAFGTQTGGSTIRPAAFNGVVGYKPSFGEFSRSGIKMQCPNLDTLGIICRSVEDLPPLRAALTDGRVRPIDKGVSGPRIGLCRTPLWDKADAATQGLIEQTASRLAAAGATVTEVSFAPDFTNILEYHRRVANYEASRNYAYEYTQHYDKVSPILRDTVLKPGWDLPLDAYIEALELAEAYRRHLDDIFGSVDVLLAPSAPSEAPEGQDSTGDASFNSIWTLGWTPCVTLPAGTGPKGLPLGVQFIGQRFRDEALFNACVWAQSRLSN